MTSPEIKRIMREAIKYCKSKGIIGQNLIIGKYYVQFSFEPKKEFCKECGRAKE